MKETTTNSYRNSTRLIKYIEINNNYLHIKRGHFVYSELV